MKAAELKFLLKLLGCPDYRSPLSEIKAADKMTVSAKEKLCRELANREILAYNTAIKKFKIEPPGKALLKLNPAQLPISEVEKTVLQACQKRTVSTQAIKIPAAELQPALQGLVDRGLIKATEEKIREVWITDRGLMYLRDDYLPSGGTTISLNLLNNYLRFLRKPFELREEKPIVARTSRQLGKPDDAAILEVIQTLDRELATENYLPIFHLREKLQPPLSRDELDQALYRLQRADKIELSSLQEAVAYTLDQVEAGIPQEIGGPLFFISVS